MGLLDTDTLHVAKRGQLFVRGFSNQRRQMVSLSDAFIRLDMCGVVQDVCRFHYVCKVLHLLLASKLSNLSGTAQKQVIMVLEATSEQVLKTENNLSILRELLKTADLALEKGRTQHIGSARLWSNHQQRVDNIKNKLDAFKLSERARDVKMTIMDLPDECLRRILGCLADHEDILHVSETSYSMYNQTEDAELWKQLCFFHFTDKQLITYIACSSYKPGIDWKFIYRQCYKRFGKKEIFADMLAMCTHCSNIFWEYLGHPCHSEEPPSYRCLTPQEFLNLFL